MTDFVDYLEACQQRINAHLDRQLQTSEPRLEKLFSALRYSVTHGGKRIRPILAYACCEALGGKVEQADAAAAAVEAIHAYSLIHDDLPAMDDDDLRRGRPTCHIAYDEATAILAGDALQALAFQWLAQAQGLKPDTRLRMIDLLACAAGPTGMVGGQAIDLDAVGEKLDLATLEHMHQHKTGALIRASVQLGALSSEQVGESQLQALARYAHCIGLAFQVQDDIIDIESDTSILGKQQGADAARNKPTYPALLGLDDARVLADSLRNQAIEALEPFGNKALRLRQLADFIVQRHF
ncbi:MAG: (2E,6E)-farnesyl diphosphate synthase [Halopseudomonas sp.]